MPRPFAPPNPPAGPHDVAQQIRETLHLKRDAKGKWQLERETIDYRKLLDKRATKQSFVFVADPYHAPVKKVEAWRSGEHITAIKHINPTRRDVFLADFKVYRIDLGRLDVGDERVTRTTRSYRYLAFAPRFNLPNIDYLSRYEIVVHHPIDVRVDFAITYTRDPLKPTISRSAGSTKLTYRNVKKATHLPHFAFNKTHAEIWPRFTVNGASIIPDTAKSSASWYRKLLERLPAPTPKVEAMAQKITAAAKNDQERVAAIYDFVRKEVRYLADERGDNAWLPRTPDFVLAKRYGDCKDKALLIQKLAASLKIPVDFVLLEAGRHPINQGHMRLAGFNHAIAAFRRGDQRLFLDGTCRDCEYGNWPEMDVHARALIIGKESARAQPVAAPQHEPSLEIDLYVDPKQPQRAKATVVLRNALNLHFLALQRKKEGAVLAAKLSKLIGKYLRGVMLEKIVVDKSKDSGSTLHAEANLDHFIVQSGKALLLPQAPFEIVPRHIIERAEDEWPIHLDHRHELRMRVHIDKAGLRLEGPQESALGKKGIATFNNKISEGEKMITASYHAKRWSKRFDGEQKAAFAQLCKSYRALVRAVFTLKKDR